MSAAFVGLVVMNKETTVSGITLYVGGTGGGNYTKIQDAINDSIDGDTVFVYNNTYYENIIVNRSINLVGMDMSNTTIDGSGLGDVVNVTSSWANITGFTITNCGTNSGDSSVELYRVTNCDISYSNLSSINGSGVFLDNSDQNGIHDNIISNNINGIHMISGMNNNFTNNIISDNVIGLYFEGSTGNTVYHNNIIGNSAHALDDGANTWNILPPIGGNFWSGWTFPDSDCDGFVDLQRYIPISGAGIMITEIMKNPAALPDATGEWFEIYNDGLTTVDINGWEILDTGVDTHIINAGGPLTIGPGEHITLAISSTPGFVPDYVYSNFILANANDEIILMNGAVTMDSIAYDTGIWPDPNGASMELADYTADNNDGSNWQVAVDVYGSGDLGTPGYMNSGVTQNYDYLPFTEESGWLSSWFNKSAFANYAPSGMPDFDQREKAQRTGQNYWMTMNAGPDGFLDPFTLTNILGDDVLVNGTPGPYNISIAPGFNHVIDTPIAGDDTLEFSYCGPTAAANALWWLDSRFADPAGVPGDMLDIYPLIVDLFPGDDHLPANAPYVIEDLAGRFNTNNMGDTNATAMVNGLQQLISLAGLSSNLSVSYQSFPDFPVVASEFRNCNAVILFLGFYDDEGKRIYGHIVTMSGVDEGGFKIAISDPIKNIENPLPSYSSYNDTINVSHDIYDVMMGPPHPSLPPPTWWLSPYTSGYNFPPPFIYWAVVEDVVYIKPQGGGPTVPTEPLGLSESSGKSYVNLTWMVPSSDGGSAIIGYNVYRDGSFLTFVTGLWYNDTAVTNGVTYDYNVSAVNGVGEGPKSTGVSATPEGVPDVPQNLQANPGDGFVNLTWLAPADDGGSPILFYNIYRNGTVGVYDTVPASQLWYNDSSVINGLTYTYNISAVNALGEGPQTTDVMGTPTSSATVPSEPLNLQADSGDSYVNLSWIAPASDGGSAITGYNIYRNGTFLIFVSGQLWYNDTTVSNGVTYTYNVTAVNGVGEGPNSTGVSATPMTVPTVPQSPATTTGNGYVEINWTTPADDGGSPILWYYVYRSINTGVYAIVPAGQLWYNDTNVTNGVTYTYNISAVNAVGEGPRTGDVSGTPMTLALAPQNLQANSGNGFINLTWTAPSDDGGSPILFYNIYRNGTVGIYDIVPASQFWYNDSNVTNGLMYTYNISAVNSVGEGPQTGDVSGIPATVASEPQNLLANSGNSYVNLTWTAPASSGGSPIVGFNIYRNGTFLTFVTGQLWYNDSSVTNGVNYTYNVTAINGVGEGPNSTGVSAIPMTVPSVVENLGDDSGSGYVNLSWDVPLDDGGSPITNYYIYKNGTVGPIAIISGSQRWYNDSAVSNGITYTYNVSAVNSVGEGPNSTISATPDITTLPTVPQNLQSTSGDSYVNVTWNVPASDGGSPIIEYYVYRNDTAGPIATVPAGQLWYNDATVTNGQLYSYNVSAVNIVGEGPNATGALGNPLSVPSAVQNLQVVASLDLINLSWETPLTDGGTPITGYNVYRNGTPGVYAVIPPGQLWYNDTNVLNNTMYTYNITAENMLGESPAAVVLGTPLTTPTEPLNLQASAGSEYVLLTWNASLNNGSSDITAYNIYRNDTSGIYDMVFGDQFEYNDTLAQNGEDYTYHVVAVNAQGLSPNSTNASARPEGVPLVPESFTADPGNGFVNLSWAEPFDGGQPITEYFLYKNGTVGPYATLPPGQLWFNDTAVTNGIVYTYTISANNSLGEGEISEDNVVMAGSPPSAPYDLTITPGDSTITITWKVPKTDGGMPLTHYRVYQGISSGNLTEWVWFITDLSYTDLTVENGLTYYYVVTAFNFVGESVFSEEVFAVPIGIPDAPLEFSATAYDSYVILTWSEPFTDGGSPITGYKLYRGTTSNESNATLLTSDLDANDFSFNDSTVTNDITYFYWISAETIEGEGPKATSNNATPEGPVETVNEIPTIEIVTPFNDVRWYGTATISGTASDSDGEVERVEIRFNDGSWIEVNGTTDWTYEVDTKELPNGEMVIYARSFDGENYSKEVNVTVNVDNPTSVKEKGLLEEPGFWVGFIFLMLILLLIIFMLLKKRKPKEEEYEDEEEEEEDEDEEDEEEDEGEAEEEEEEDEDELEEED
jgi:parallel beta-helix repeat protein